MTKRGHAIMPKDMSKVTLARSRQRNGVIGGGFLRTGSKGEMRQLTLTFTLRQYNKLAKLAKVGALSLAEAARQLVERASA